MVALIVTATMAGTAVASSPAQAVPAAVRGFDGKTLTVAGLGLVSQLPGAATGSQARIKRFNDDEEIKGVTIKYAEQADDKADPATALSEARRLVTQVGVFAIVGDTSANNPGDFLNQQHVPYFGYAFDNTYCSNTPSTKLYGFGFNGCLVPATPKAMPDNAKAVYEYVAQTTGKQHPTAALFSADNQSGNNTAAHQKVSYAGAGFNIVYSKGVVPPPPVSDYTPYAQAVLTSDNGKAPDAIICLLATDCIPMYSLIQANNYKGTYLSSLYSDVLVKPMNGSVAGIPFVNLAESTPGLTQLKNDVDAVKPGAAIDTGVLAGYLSTDMFLQALKTVAKKGTSNITPENVQKVAATQTWQIKGLAGPTKYPASTVASTPYCGALVSDNGSAWVTVIPYTCSSKRYPIK